MAMAKLDSGYFSAEISAQDSGTIVEYYLQTEHDYFTWCSPVGAPDTVYSYTVGNITDITLKRLFPAKFKLNQNYPNPFNPTTIITYAIPKSEHVKITIDNTLGQRIEILFDTYMPTGHHQVKFNGQNLPSGVYYYRLEAGEYVQIRKMLLVK
jgi:hypothetical protein